MAVQEKTGAEALVDIMIEEGVEYIFGLPGGSAIPLFDALVGRNIKLVLTRHEQGAVHISAISTWEVYMLVAKGRLSLRLAAEVWVARCERLSFLRFDAVDNDIARLAAQACGAMHADPADRIIVATALYLGCPVATCDAKIQDCGLISAVW